MHEKQIKPDYSKEKERSGDHAKHDPAKEPRCGIMPQFMVGELLLDAHLRTRLDRSFFRYDGITGTRDFKKRRSS